MDCLIFISLKSYTPVVVGVLWGCRRYVDCLIFISLKSYTPVVVGVSEVCGLPHIHLAEVLHTSGSGCVGGMWTASYSSR